jgi:DnaA family protein
MSVAVTPTRQLPLHLAAASEPGFGNFLPGANAAALDHLRRLRPPAPPVYLWGPAGSGKSHLLQALAAAVRAQGGSVLRLGDDWPPADGPRLLLIDDCELLDAAGQAEAFRAFVEAATQGVQVAAAGRVPPVDLSLREDLRTRLGWGLVFGLQPLTEAETRDALRSEAAGRGIPLPDDLLDHLMTRFARDLKHLMTLLDRLDRYALARKRAVTVTLLRQMLQEGEAGSW